MRDYSSTPLARKLGITPGARVALVNAPAGFAAALGDLPEGASIAARPRGPLDVVVLFSTSRSEAARRFPGLVDALEPAGGLWVAYPKKTSGVATDLDFSWVQNLGLEAGLVDNKSCSVDATYTALRFVYRRADRPG